MAREFKYADDVNLAAALAYFKSLGRPFRIETTGSSTALIGQRAAWIIAAEPFLPWHLGILSKVKAEVRSNAAHVDGMPESDRECFKVNALQFPGAAGRFLVQEIDLTAAYLSSAVTLGLLCQDTADRIKRLPKRWRLRILGAIATRRRVQYFDAAGRPINAEYVVDAALRHCWFVIVGHVDRFERILTDLAGPHFVFYWYDNFLARPGAVPRSMLEATGRKFKIEDRSLDYHRTSNLILATIDSRRRFFLPVPDLTASERGR